MRRHRPWTIPLAIVLLYLCFAIASARTLIPWCDEGWFYSPAINLLTKGYMGTSVLDPTASWRSVRLTGIDRYTYWIMPLYPVAQTAWYRLVGPRENPGLFSMRLFSVAWGLLALAAWYATVWKLAGDRRYAAAAALFLALDFRFLWTAGAGRMDMMCAALGACAAAAFLWLREKHFGMAVLVSQTLVAAAGLTHPTGIVALGWLVFLTLFYDARLIRPRHVALAAAPYLIGAVGWGLYISQNPPLFAAQFGGNASDRWLALRAPLESLRLEIAHRFLDNYGLSAGAKSFGHMRLVVLAAYAAGVAGCLWNGAIRRRFRVLLALLAIAFVTIMAIDGEKQVYYLIHTVPLLAALFGVWLSWSWEHGTAPRRAAVAAVAGLVICVQITVAANRIRQNLYRNTYLATTEYLKRHATKGDLVMGSAELAFELGFDGAVVDDYRLGCRSGKHPDFIVLDGNRYQEWIPLLEKQSPADFACVRNLLARDFHLVLDVGAYRVYARR